MLKRLIIPIIIVALYFTGIFIQRTIEPTLSPENYEHALIIANSQGLFDRLSHEEVGILAQTIVDVHAENLGLEPITVNMDSSMRHAIMMWSNSTRTIHINSNRLNAISVHQFRETLGHELRHAVQFAAVFGEPTNVVISESDIQIFRDNIANYQSPDSDWAMLNFAVYHNQPIEVDARIFGSQFRAETRRFVPRIPDSSELQTLILFTLFLTLIVTARTHHIPAPPPSFKRCIADLHDKKKAARKPLKLATNLHQRLAAELRMIPSGYIELLPRSSEFTSISHGAENHTEMAINKSCFAHPEKAIAAIAEETWRICHLAFDDLSEAEELAMQNYVNSILSRASVAISH